MSKELGKSTPEELQDAFVNITFEEKAGQSEDRLYDQWVDKASAQRSDPLVFASDALRASYPGYSVVISQTSILEFPHAIIQPVAPESMITTSVFIPFARRLGNSGVIVNYISYGAFRVAWDKFDFILYVTRYTVGFGTYVAQFILHQGSDEPARSLLVAAGIWQDALHEEIWVFNQGYWQKDAGLYHEVQKANWNDIILEEKFKAALQKDIEGFFTSEHVYKELAIPWKRGVILYGPPGNGKTISVKAIMKACTGLGHVPLYVKSFTSFMGDEASMELIFDKARSQAPCVMILEDLDSLITERNRSFFLNQIDGLEGNDGLLVVGTTNHLEKLDPALSSRPSRFDRKYLFDNPTIDDRLLYVQYWQEKLKNNEEISFPDDLKGEIAGITSGFSFSYLKEAFVSSLVLLAGYEGEKPPFRTVIKEQIADLRSQLDKTGTAQVGVISPANGFIGGRAHQNARSIPRLSESELTSSARIYRAEPSKPSEGGGGPFAIPRTKTTGRSFTF